MSEDKKSTISNPDVWIRLIYMLLFAMLTGLSRLVIGVIAILQWITLLITGEDNRNLRDVGQGVAKWALQANLFLTFNSETKPFPFTDWPNIEVTERGDETSIITDADEDPSPIRTEEDLKPANDPSNDKLL